MNNFEYYEAEKKVINAAKKVFPFLEALSKRHKQIYSNCTCPECEFTKQIIESGLFTQNENKD